MEGQPAPSRNILQVVFLSPGEPRLRAGWRLLAQTIVMLVLTVFMTIALVPFILTVNMSGTLGMFLNQIAELVAFTGSIFLVRRVIDKRSIASLGLQPNPLVIAKDILAGIGITFLVMGAIYMSMSALGWITFEGFAWHFEPTSAVLTNVALNFAVFVFVGWNEELLSRGYHLQTIASGTNLIWGVVLSSSVFGFMHWFNPGATWVSTVGIFFAGLFLALGYLRTGQLWLSIGLHIGWNFFEGVVFGFPVSGLDIYPLTRIQVTGPEIWTGGSFGPEAGLIVLPAMILGSILIFAYTLNRTDRPNVS
jgi:membrane protease YdiL (CAAX protease family)